MSVAADTKAIRELVGAYPSDHTAFDLDLAIYVYKNLELELKPLLKLIQKAVDVQADGVYGPRTAEAIKGALDPELVPAVVPVLDDDPPRVNFKETYRPSPNVSGPITPKGAVLHHSYGSYEGGVSWILNDDSNVSYHCLIDKNGDRTVFAHDDRRAWHAGRSKFHGKSQCNGFLLGIAFSDNTLTRELTRAEVDSAVEFLLPRFKKWGWPTDLSTITTHREISPGRKSDVDKSAEEKVLTALRAALKQ